MRPLAVGMLLYPGLTQLDLTGPFEVFSRLPDSRVQLIAATRAPVRSDHGLTIAPDATFEDAPACDVIVVPGGLGVVEMMEDEPLLGFLRRQGASARYVTSVCTGALLLGAAGLLRGRRATTHWMFQDMLSLFGAEPVRERVVVDGNRITGGGITAGIDFGLVLAAQLRGEAVAQRIQLLLEYDPAPPFRSGTPASAPPEVLRTLLAARASGQPRWRAAAERASQRLATGG